MRTPVLLVMIAAGLASADPVRERLAKLPAPAVVLSGRVVDAATHEPLAGVTVVAESALLEHGEAVVGAEDGSWALEVPNAPTLVSFYDGDATYERWVMPGRLDIEIAVPPPPPPPCAGELASNPKRADVEALVAAVLRRDHQTKLVRSTDLIRRVPPPFQIVREPELRALADRAGKWQIAVAIESIEIAGPCAVVTWGHDHTPPSTGEQVCLCGDSSRDLYERRGGAWVFVKTLGSAAG